ncbi:MAG: HNH endonuclease [Burkholderiales bacterium]|nr:HNH endonuclease [Anaerolineae bacterium]
MTYIPANLRLEVTERAGNCCEYCLRSQSDVVFKFHIEHIIAEKHGGQTVTGNLALSCSVCNTYKGTDIASADPQTGLATFLYHPRKQNWSDHFYLQNAITEPLTAEARVTVFLLRFNDERRVEERKALIRLKRYPCQKE